MSLDRIEREDAPICDHEFESVTEKNGFFVTSYARCVKCGLRPADIDKASLPSDEEIIETMAKAMELPDGYVAGGMRLQAGMLLAGIRAYNKATRGE